LTLYVMEYVQEEVIIPRPQTTVVGGMLARLLLELEEELLASIDDMELPLLLLVEDDEELDILLELELELVAMLLASVEDLLLLEEELLETMLDSILDTMLDVLLDITLELELLEVLVLDEELLLALLLLLWLVDDA